MFPVLFSIGTFSISSFGVMIALGYLLAIFLIWRLARAWDLDEEKVLDLTLLTFLGGLIGARVYFVLENWSLFGNFLKVVLFYKYPGFSFWGGVLGGWLTLYFFSRRFKLDFWQIADISSVGFLGALIFGNIGCFLGGCGVGIPSKLFFAVSQVGTVGARFPTQALEAIVLSLALFKIWGVATHFHLRGTVIATTLILISLIKLTIEPLRANHGLNFFFLTVLLTLGLVIFYRVTKRNALEDTKNIALFLIGVVTKKSNRKLLLFTIKKSWYNQMTAFGWKLRNLKKFLRSINVKFSHKENRSN